jgi:glycerophosphoryl diester phosphodiesterase
LAELRTLRAKERLPAHPASRRARQALRLRRVRRPAHLQGPGEAHRPGQPCDSSNHLQRPASLIRDAHHVGLLVHPFTFRNENTFLPQDFRQGNPASPEFLRARGDSPAEFRLFFGLDVDRLFTDDADTAVATRTEMFGR